MKYAKKRNPFKERWAFKAMIRKMIKEIKNYKGYSDDDPTVLSWYVIPNFTNRV